MDERWLILADDLTGAADCAIAFAQRRLAAKVVWGATDPAAHRDALVLSFDTETRGLDAAAAARGQVAAMQRFFAPATRIFKKVDSTMRGHPAEEIAALLDVLATSGPVRAIFAPAFPAMGRTTVNGRVLVDGIPLEHTEYWLDEAREDATLVGLLERAGLQASNVPLSQVRANVEALRAGLERIFARRDAHAVAVCDAESEADLERIVAASRGAGQATLFIGSAGLAHALARQVSQGGPRRTTPQRFAPSVRGALIVVGSQARASRAGWRELVQLPGVRGIHVEPAMLSGDLRTGAHAALTRDITRLLDSGTDVAVDILSAEPHAPARTPRLVVALAQVLAPVAAHVSGIAATGGETAVALLSSFGVTGLRLVDEIEPGVSLGLTLGALSIPAITKAGGFGNEGCLTRIAERLRFIRQTGTVA